MTRAHQNVCAPLTSSNNSSHRNELHYLYAMEQASVRCATSPFHIETHAHLMISHFHFNIVKLNFDKWHFGIRWVPVRINVFVCLRQCLCQTLQQLPWALGMHINLLSISRRGVKTILSTKRTHNVFIFFIGILFVYYLLSPFERPTHSVDNRKMHNVIHCLT